jgi:hypothetical protein
MSVVNRRKVRYYVHLVAGFIPHPFIPSPAGIIGKQPQIFMAGEGSVEERGQSPLSYSLPLSNKEKTERPT